MSKLSRENTLKMKGAGDGIKPTPRPERTPVPSSRKFTATLARDESVQIKLKKVLDDMEAKQRTLKKSKTVAEITPTKSTQKKAKRPVGGASVVLHATPRPPLVDMQETPSGRDEKERRLELLVYHRMLVFVWRRSKKRLAMVSESLRRRQEQISNLEKQVDCLKDLNHSECSKRVEVMGEYQRIEIVLQNVRMENNSLLAAKVVLQKELDELKNKFENSCTEVENMKNEINTKNIYMKRLEQELYKHRNELKAIKEENKSLVDKVKERECEIKSAEGTTNTLTETIRFLETQLEDAEDEKKALNKLTQDYKIRAEGYSRLKQEVSRVYSLRDEMSRKIDSLENQLAEMSEKYEKVCKTNKDLMKNWWENTKEFMQVSWAVLQHAAYLMLPAL